MCEHIFKCPNEGRGAERRMKIYGNNTPNFATQIFPKIFLKLGLPFRGVYGDPCGCEGWRARSVDFYRRFFPDLGPFFLLFGSFAKVLIQPLLSPPYNSYFPRYPLGLLEGLEWVLSTKTGEVLSLRITDWVGEVGGGW